MTGEATKVQKPVDSPYKGNLYILINGGSFSNSGIVSSLLAANNRGIFIGEETGGNRYIISGDAGNGTLPITRINCEISSKKYQIQQTDKNDGHGTIPSYYVTSNIDDFKKNNDKAKELAFGLIKTSDKSIKH